MENEKVEQVNNQDLQAAQEIFMSLQNQARNQTIQLATMQIMMRQYFNKTEEEFNAEFAKIFNEQKDEYVKMLQKALENAKKEGII